MIGIAKHQGRWARTALATLAAGVLAVPLASAWATSEDPAQAAAVAADGAGATLTAEQVTLARETFNNFSCGACHTLGDADATGQIGPSLDGNANLDHAFIVSRVVNGQGAMPGFGGQIPDEDIAMLATYIMQVKK